VHCGDPVAHDGVRRRVAVRLGPRADLGVAEPALRHLVAAHVEDVGRARDRVGVAGGSVLAFPVGAEMTLHEATDEDRIADEGTIENPPFVAGTFVVGGIRLALLDLEALLRTASVSMGNGWIVPVTRRKMVTAIVAARSRMKLYAGIANAHPDSRVPRRLTIVINRMRAIANPTRCSCNTGKADTSAAMPALTLTATVKI
jgi:hypothetical protein